MISYEDLNDYELISMAEEQNEEAINLLYKKYQPIFQQKSHKLLNRFHNKGIDLEDLIQECTIAFEEALRKFNPSDGASFYTFVNACLDKHLLSILTRASRLKNKFLNEAIPIETTIDESDTNLIACIEDNSNNPELDLLSNEDLNTLSQTILKNLTDFEECVFNLKIQGFTANEIASILDKDEKSIYNTVQRIKSKIKSTVKILKNNY